MAAVDVLGTVADRLVGGMMFHSDHADLCSWLGVRWLSELHEDGYLHDSKCLRRVHRDGITFLGLLVPDGRQQRSHALDAHMGRTRWCVQHDDIVPAIRLAMEDWCDWEDGTAKAMNAAYRRLFDCGETAVACRVKAIARDTEEELAEARGILAEMEAVCWDLPHIMQMGGRR